MHTHQIETLDIYEAGYYVASGCIVDNVEVTTENKQTVCKFILSGETLPTLQQNYFQATATINLYEFRRAYSRLMSLSKNAKNVARIKAKADKEAQQ